MSREYRYCQRVLIVEVGPGVISQTAPDQVLYTSHQAAQPLSRLPCLAVTTSFPSASSTQHGACGEAEGCAGSLGAPQRLRRREWRHSLNAATWEDIYACSDGIDETVE